MVAPGDDVDHTVSIATAVVSHTAGRGMVGQILFLPLMWERATPTVPNSNLTTVPIPHVCTF